MKRPITATELCEECGSNGEGGEVEQADGRLWHFRKRIKGGLIQPIRCYGNFTEGGRSPEEARLIAGGAEALPE